MPGRSLKNVTTRVGMNPNSPRNDWKRHRVALSAASCSHLSASSERSTRLELAVVLTPGSDTLPPALDSIATLNCASPMSTVLAQLMSTKYQNPDHLFHSSVSFVPPLLGSSSYAFTAAVTADSWADRKADDRSKHLYMYADELETGSTSCG